MASERIKNKSFSRYFLIGCGTVIIVVAALVIWLGVQIVSTPGDVEMTPHHPFRSAQAKERYLQLYDAMEKNWPIKSESLMVDTSYGKTFLRVSGPTDAPPLVLLPGAAANSLLWTQSIAGLSEHYRTFAVDNVYDFGRSIYSRRPETPNDLVTWLDELFRALELGDRIHLMGLSYGGWITIQYALQRPERLSKAVLLAPAATVLPFEPEFLMRAVLCLLPHRYFTRSMMYWVLEDAARQNESLVEEGAEHFFVGQRSYKPIRMVNPTVLTDAEWQSIQVPTLFMVGENEKIYSAQKAVERLKTVAPAIEIEVIPDVGHDLTLVQSEMVNGKILEFLKQP